MLHSAANSLWHSWIDNHPDQLPICKRSKFQIILQELIVPKMGDCECFQSLRGYETLTLAIRDPKIGVQILSSSEFQPQRQKYKGSQRKGSSKLLHRSEGKLHGNWLRFCLLW